MKTLEPRFFEFIPEQKEEGILYISMEYCTAIHKCACGCGNQVVTPLSPSGWQLNYDGEVISLYPSIGNWNFPCKSHYWIKKNKIIHCNKWSDTNIDDMRKTETVLKQSFFIGKLKKLKSKRKKK